MELVKFLDLIVVTGCVTERMGVCHESRYGPGDRQKIKFGKAELKIQCLSYKFYFPVNIFAVRLFAYFRSTLPRAVTGLAIIGLDSLLIHYNSLTAYIT